MFAMLPLSVLDLSFTTTDTARRLRGAQYRGVGPHVDTLGYHRFWVAEHHNLASVASGAPEIMIGAIAAATRHLRVGSGGVMLPNHAPLMVAERFKVLEALYPGRIDLGIGRAPGTDPMTSLALRRRQEVRADDDFLERFNELMLWKTGSFPDGHPFRAIRVMPEDVPVPPIWLLGSGAYSAELAGRVGLGFAFAHHFASIEAADAIGLYRSSFQASAWLQRPHAILATAAVCAGTEVEAEWLAATVDFSYVRRMSGDYRPLASPEEAKSYNYSPHEEQARRANRARVFVGSPHELRNRLATFAEAAGADEIMLTTPVFSQDARVQSYRLLAEAFELPAPPRS